MFSSIAVSDDNDMTDDASQGTKDGIHSGEMVTVKTKNDAKIWRMEPAKFRSVYT